MQVRARAVGTPAACISSFENAFEPSTSAAPDDGPKTGDARAPQGVAEAEHERQLRADHDEPDLEVVGERDEAADVVDGDVVAGRDARDAGVAGSAVQFATGGARGERLRQRVLPPARADEQDPHRAESTERQRCERRRDLGRRQQLELARP